MDHVVNSNDESESLIEDEEDIGCAGGESEKCGICRDVIIDRGILNGCNHWFCFPCVDQWAAMMNHCPLCKTKFTFFACRPVYDTTGSLTTEEQTFLRTFRQVTSDRMVERCIAVDREYDRMTWGGLERKERYIAFVRRCSDAGNSEANCILGVQLLSTHGERYAGISRLLGAKESGHEAAAYILGMLYFQEVDTRVVGVELLNMLATGCSSCNCIRGTEPGCLILHCRRKTTSLSWCKTFWKLPNDMSLSSCANAACGRVIGSAWMPDDELRRTFCSPLCRDEDWCIQGNNNTLSFPSYYINEDAVKCLDGDKCKVRNGFLASNEDLGCDTSVTCDSCDIWYHAFCVGFSSRVTSGKSWLCPRCMANNVQDNILSIQNPAKYSAHNSTDLGVAINHSFLGRVSVSVADTGDTDVVVSLINEQKMMDAIESSSETKESINSQKEAQTPKHFKDDGKGELSMQESKSGCNELTCSNIMSIDEFRKANAPEKKCSGRTLDIASGAVDSELQINLRGKSVIISEQNAVAAMITTQPSNSPVKASLPPSSSQVDENTADATENQMLDSRTGCLDESYVSVEKIVYAIENEIATGSSTSPSELAGDKMVTRIPEEQGKVKCQENVEVNGKKDMEKLIKHAKDAGHEKNYIRKRERGKQVKMEAETPTKKAKSDKKPLVLPSRCRVNSSDSGFPRKCSTTEKVSKDKLKYVAQKQDVSIDIMGVVQETGHRFHDGSSIRKPAGLTIKKRDDAAGVRVKKIMHQPRDKRETSMLVQKLRNEIREAVQDKSYSNTGKDDASDAKLLKAIRAAIIKPEKEPCRKLDLSFAKVSKPSLQKGKIRDNLTKKIYGTSSGRRRRAWDREREIEFWKYRCGRMKHEKVETLQSVLELLRKATNPSSENTEMDQGPEGDTENSFLSRVYLADASVLPRKDDIKPLSALTASSLINNKKENNVNISKDLAKKDSQAVHEKNIAKTPMAISDVSSQVSSSNAPGRRLSTSGATDEGFSRNRNLGVLKSGSTSIYGSAVPKGGEQNLKKQTGQADSGRSDKRKWAVDVLARKNALMNPDASREAQGDAWLNGKYPLLAQLPKDMRPVPAPSHDKKFPSSVRQAQLYRITEHYLRRGALSVIRRTAETELAVADAINIEKDIFEKSRSKSVYINLCSQFISQLAKIIQSTETVACQSPARTAEDADLVMEEISFEPAANDCSRVEEALKLAGLSDSPPPSPYTTQQDLHEGDNHDNIQGEAVESVLDTDCDPDLDIFGDFEYDLEDDNHIISSSSSALGLSKVQHENGESRIKVGLSTLKCKGSVVTMNSKNDTEELQSASAAWKGQYNLKSSDMESDSSMMFEGKRECGTGDVTTNCPVLIDPPHAGIYKELSVEEYELYGPDNETLTNKMSHDAELGQLNNTEIAAVNGANPENKDGATIPMFMAGKHAEYPITNDGAHLNHESCQTRNVQTSLIVEHVRKEGRLVPTSNKLPDLPDSISRKVEAFVKEHIRPLCKSGVITIEQYRWAVGKTTDKVMKFQYKAKSASFLIKGGEKVKRLAEQYVEAAQQKKLE